MMIIFCGRGVYLLGRLV